MDPTRRTLLTTSAAVAAAAAAQRAFGQTAREQPAADGQFYEKGKTRIHYREAGKGFPLLIIPGGGLNWRSAAPRRSTRSLNSATTIAASSATCATRTTASRRPVEIDRPWDAYTDDHLGLDGSPPHRQVHGARVLHRRPVHLELVAARARARRRGRARAAERFSQRDARPLYQNNITGWGPPLVERRPEVTMEMVEGFLTKMYRTNADFVFTVTREFVRSCQTPVLNLPDDIPAHPYAIAMKPCAGAEVPRRASTRGRSRRSGFRLRCGRFACSCERIDRLRRKAPTTEGDARRNQAPA